MTEAEAKTKWCPLARVIAKYGKVSANRDKKQDDAFTKIEENAKCIGSACMAWRWSGERKTVHYTETLSETKAVTTQVYEGFCGAFGRE